MSELQFTLELQKRRSSSTNAYNCNIQHVCTYLAAAAAAAAAQSLLTPWAVSVTQLLEIR